MNLRVIPILGGFVILAGCTEDVPPPTVQEYLDDPIALEAAMVRCSANRAETRYRAECVNARQAVALIEAKEERERRAAFEAESAAKRAALRRRQEAAAEARRRAEEAARLREEAEYLAQFGELPPREDEQETAEESAVNAPAAIVPPAPDEEVSPPAGESLPPAGSNAPTVETEPTPGLEAIREELRRRNEGSSN